MVKVLGRYKELNINPIRFTLLRISPTLIHQNAVTHCKVELMQLVYIIPRHAGQGGQVRTHAEGG